MPVSRSDAREAADQGCKNRDAVVGRETDSETPPIAEVPQVRYDQRMKAPLCVIAAIIGGAVLANTAEKATGIGPSFKGPLGLQMYSLRFHTGTNALAKIDKARELGFRAIE